MFNYNNASANSSQALTVSIRHLEVSVKKKISPLGYFSEPIKNRNCVSETTFHIAEQTIVCDHHIV